MKVSCNNMKHHTLTLILTITYLNSFGQIGNLIVDTTKWENGKIKSIEKYLDTKNYKDKKNINSREGNFLYFYETGELKESRFYKNGSQDSVIIYFFKNGNKKEEGVLSPCRAGIWTEWFENGKKESQGKWDCNTRLEKWSFWDIRGFLKSEIEYNDTVYKSTFYSYHPNGKVKTISKYKGPYILTSKLIGSAFKESDGVILFADYSKDYKHTPIGEWQTFDEKETLTETEIFAE
jgi:antitoxin component YwqK of YwqJK toxin-antitoxin module